MAVKGDLSQVEELLHAIDAITKVLSTCLEFSNLRTKRLNVTYAYYSVLTAPMIDVVEQAAEDLERITESHLTLTLTPRFFADHMRNPLEAGSSSLVTHLAKRSMSDVSGHTFIKLNITNDKALDSLAETTASLLRAGVPLAFWLHHPSQSQDYAPLILPLYQFEKSRH
ncbi:hypothetical protein D6C89_07597 [Aureobasidium pullulans]|nr:hypothetical protein D6C89_07597 [Aureobasidium pullulans]